MKRERSLLIALAVATFVPLAAWSASSLSGAAQAKEKAAMARYAPEAVVIGPSSAFIEVAIDDGTGQFTMGEPNGGPILLYGHPSPWSSFTSIQVDGQVYTNKGQPFGTLLQPPTTTGNTSEMIFQVGPTPIQVHQLITLVTGSSTGHADTYLVQYKLVNTDTSGHTVGCRIMFDPNPAMDAGESVGKIEGMALAFQIAVHL